MSTTRRRKQKQPLAEVTTTAADYDEEEKVGHDDDDDTTAAAAEQPKVKKTRGRPHKEQQAKTTTAVSHDNDDGGYEVVEEAAEQPKAKKARGRSHKQQQPADDDGEEVAHDDDDGTAEEQPKAKKARGRPKTTKTVSFDGGQDDVESAAVSSGSSRKRAKRAKKPQELQMLEEEEEEDDCVELDKNLVPLMPQFGRHTERDIFPSPPHGVIQTRARDTTNNLMHSVEHRGHVLYFLYKQGRSAEQAREEMNTVYGQKYIRKDACKKAFDAFKKLDDAQAATMTISSSSFEQEMPPRDLVYGGDDLGQILDHAKWSGEPPDHLALSEFGDFEADIVCKRLTHLCSLILMVSDTNYRTVWPILRACRQLEFLGLVFTGGYGSDEAVRQIARMPSIPPRSMLPDTLKHMWLYYADDNVDPTFCFGHFLLAAPPTLQSLTVDANASIELGTQASKGHAKNNFCDHFAKSLQALALNPSSQADVQNFLLSKCGDQMRALTLRDMTLDAKQFHKLIDKFPWLEHFDIQTSAGLEAAQLLDRLPNLRSIELVLYAAPSAYHVGPKTIKIAKKEKSTKNEDAKILAAFRLLLAKRKLELFYVDGIKFPMDFICDLVIKCPNIAYISCEIADFHSDRLLAALRERNDAITMGPDEVFEDNTATMEQQQEATTSSKIHREPPAAVPVNTTFSTTSTIGCPQTHIQLTMYKHNNPAYPSEQQCMELAQLGLRVEQSRYAGERNPILREWNLAGMSKKPGNEFLAIDTI